MNLPTFELHCSNETHLLRLPDEVIQKILFFCDPDDVYLNVKRVCQRFFRLVNEPLLWRFHCCVNFRYWDKRHGFQEKLRRPTGQEDWKSLYCYRRMVDLKTTELLNSILETQTNRISKYEAIARFGYDAKETLLRHIQVDENAHDVLARRYYAKSVLDYIHRIIALEEWQKILDNKNVPIESALGCFDLFILQDRTGDFSEISVMFDKIAQRFRCEYLGIDNLSPKAKAQALIDFMRRHCFIGNLSSWAYERIQSYFIGLYLQDPECPPLPLISITIFCAIGRRINLDAHCCGIPDYLHVVVLPRPGETLDAKKLKDGETCGEPMYLDPYQFMREVPIQILRKNLSNLGFQSSLHMRYLSDMSTASLVQRMSKTIMTTVNNLRANQENFRADGHSVARQSNFSTAELEKAHYSALWADFLFADRSRLLTSGVQQSHLVPIILERNERLYPMDACLIEKYILPFYNNHRNSRSSETYNQILETLRDLRNADQTPKMIRLRRPPANQNVRYKIGQVFRHKRYYYTGVIIGWDLEGENFDWAFTNDARSLLFGMYQSFYNVLVEDTSIRYVAEENIEILKPEFPSSLMSLAGKYFNRWDGESHIFISAIRDEYPED
ncbi:putative f-box domain-containing protein [Erysiphe necator]|uniref:Putative f-box domain-containing protein n=1 Tax=Uncinula necator TaxID=52586 RepID=A0A0B1P7T0_UNCNE|nr:putative f-box domain-containing protein [Erysiphe necator]